MHFGRRIFLMPYFLNVSLGSWYCKSCFVRLFVKILDVAVCSFDEYAMSLDHSIGHDSFKSREQNVSNNKDKRL